MKKLFTKWQWGVLAVIAVSIAACKSEQLADVLSKETFAAVNVSVPARLDIGTGSSFTVNAGDVAIPVTVSFSSATTRAFALNLGINVDTVATLVTANTLPAGTIAFTSSTASVAQTVNVPIGVTSLTTNLSVSRSFIELNYGKNIAVVLKATGAEKGNKLVAGKTATVVMVKTAEVLSAASVHFISFGVTNVSLPSAAGLASGLYTMGSDNVTFNIPVNITGDLGTLFNVTAASAPDSVTKYINSGRFANSQLYPDSKVSFATPSISFAANSPTAMLTFSTKLTALLGTQTASGVPTAKLQVIAFKISNPSKFKVDGTKDVVYVTIDANGYRPYYGTPFLVKGTIGAVSDPIYGAYYDLGGEGIAYHDNTSKDGDGNWRAPDNVDVVPDYTPRSVIGWTANDEYLTYSINVEQTGNYYLDTYQGASGTGGRWTIFIDNVLITPTQQAILSSTGPNNNNQKAWPLVISTQTPTSPGTVALTAGYHIVKMYWNTASYDYRGIIFTRKN